MSPIGYGPSPPVRMDHPGSGGAHGHTLFSPPLGFASGLVVAVGSFAFVDAHVDGAPALGREPEEEAGFGLHVGEEGIRVVGDVLVDQLPGDRPDVEVGQPLRFDEAVDADMAGDGLEGFDA